MKVGVFSCKPYERAIFESRGVHYGFDLFYIETSLNIETVALAKPFDMICVFVDDDISAPVLDALQKFAITHIALRCLGFNNIDLVKAQNLGISVSRVRNYSADSVAEHTVALILALNRKLLKSNNRILNNNFDLNGLLGFNLRGKTVGIIGTGAIGTTLISILSGFGCRILCYDPSPSKTLKEKGFAYVDLPALIRESNIISLHCPLTAQTQHMIGHTEIRNMKDNVMLINTSRGGVMNTQAIISGLKSCKIGYLGIDMHEMESALFTENIVCERIPDNTYRRLATFPNVLITYHQGFFTHESMVQIIDTTLINLQHCFVGKVCDKTFLA
ncbi:MAG: D-lactate dehydrogenase [Patiriisocius sp.]|jgi:D-lactate dehydrogenase